MERATLNVLRQSGTVPLNGVFLHEELGRSFCGLQLPNPAEVPLVQEGTLFSLNVAPQRGIKAPWKMKSATTAVLLGPLSIV